jgi:hypothetical protein
MFPQFLPSPDVEGRAQRLWTALQRALKRIWSFLGRASGWTARPRSRGPRPQPRKRRRLAS